MKNLNEMSVSELYALRYSIDEILSKNNRDEVLADPDVQKLLTLVATLKKEK